MMKCRPTITITNFAPTSLLAILPSGETLLFVKPGISRVVGRIRGVELPEPGARRGIPRLRPVESDAEERLPCKFGLLGAEVAGVSFNAVAHFASCVCPFMVLLILLGCRWVGLTCLLASSRCPSPFCESVLSNWFLSWSTFFSSGTGSSLARSICSWCICVFDCIANFAKLDCWLCLRRKFLVGLLPPPFVALAPLCSVRWRKLWLLLWLGGIECHTVVDGMMLLPWAAAQAARELRLKICWVGGLEFCFFNTSRTI